MGCFFILFIVVIVFLNAFLTLNYVDILLLLLLSFVILVVVNREKKK